MRLNLWLADEDGVVLVFTALVLPVVLLVGVFILQSGELYRRQAELQFVAQQTANSVLIPVGEVLKNQAEVNFEATCNTEFPPSVCSSDSLFSFLSLGEIQNLIAQASTQNLISTEAQQFVVQADPQKSLQAEDVQFSFPHAYNGGRSATARIILTEPQTRWIGNFLRPEHYTIEVTAESFLKLET